MDYKLNKTIKKGEGMKNVLCAGLLVFGSILTGCLDSSESDQDRQIREADEAIQSYLQENDRTATKYTTGVYLEVLEENPDGREVLPGNVVGIHYRMTDMGRDVEIEAHDGAEDPLRFVYNYSQGYNGVLPAGLNYEIGHRRQGDRVRYYIPNYQAYGNYAHEGLFDARTNFELDVTVAEVLTEEEVYEEESAEIQDWVETYEQENEVEAESFPNSLYGVTLEEGNGASPAYNELVRIHFTRSYLDGTVIETTTDGEPAELHVSEGEMVRGLRDGVFQMNVGEKALWVMPSRLAFGPSVQVLPQSLREDWVESEDIQPVTKPYESVTYEVELLSIE